MTTTPLEPASDPNVSPEAPNPVAPGTEPEPGTDPGADPEPELDPEES